MPKPTWEQDLLEAIGVGRGPGGTDIELPTARTPRGVATGTVPTVLGRRTSCVAEEGRGFRTEATGSAMTDAMGTVRAPDEYTRSADNGLTLGVMLPGIEVDMVPVIDMVFSAPLTRRLGATV